MRRDDQERRRNGGAGILANFLMHLSPLLQGLGRQGAGNAMAHLPGVSPGSGPCPAFLRAGVVTWDHHVTSESPSHHSSTLFKPGLLMIAGKPLCSHQKLHPAPSLINRCTSVVCSDPRETPFFHGESRMLSSKAVFAQLCSTLLAPQLLGAHTPSQSPTPPTRGHHHADQSKNFTIDLEATLQIPHFTLPNITLPHLCSQISSQEGAPGKEDHKSQQRCDTELPRRDSSLYYCLCLMMGSSFQQDRE